MCWQRGPGNSALGFTSLGPAPLFVHLSHDQSSFDGMFWVEEQQLAASDAQQSDGFGQPVALSGETVVVGAVGVNCESGSICGAVYVYRRNAVSWVEEQKLMPSDTVHRDRFGISVAISGDTVVVGAEVDDNLGAAYVYRFNGDSWTNQQKLTALTMEPQAHFGISVSIVGDTVAVGAYGVDCLAGDACGSVYVHGCIPPDCNANSIPDDVDIEQGTSRDCNDNAIPDECDPDCQDNGVPDFLDIALEFSEDCDLDGIPDECQPPQVIRSVPPSGIIDARQEVSGSGLTRQGIDRIQVVFDRSVVDAATTKELTQSSFDVLDDEGTSYPVLEVIQIDDDARKFELVLVDPIQPGRWTLVMPRVLSSCQTPIEVNPDNRVVIGFLPIKAKCVRKERMRQRIFSFCVGRSGLQSLPFASCFGSFARHSAALVLKSLSGSASCQNW